MERLLFFAHLLIAMPGCQSPEARRAEVLADVDDALLRGQPRKALEHLQRATRRAPQCLPFWERTLDIRLNLGHCDQARSLLPAVAMSEHVRLYRARLGLTCDGDVTSLGEAWDAGYGTHPDLLRALDGFEPSGWRAAYELTKTLQRMRGEKDLATLRAWLAHIAAPSWYLESYLDVAGLLPELHAARDPREPPR